MNSLTRHRDLLPLVPLLILGCLKCYAGVSCVCLQRAVTAVTQLWPLTLLWMRKMISWDHCEGSTNPSQWQYHYQEVFFWLWNPPLGQIAEICKHCNTVRDVMVRVRVPASLGTQQMSNNLLLLTRWGRNPPSFTGSNITNNKRKREQI